MRTAKTMLGMSDNNRIAANSGKLFYMYFTKILIPTSEDAVDS